MSYHVMIIVGNLGKDPEKRYTPTGEAVTTMSVATNRVYTDANGQKIKETTWFKVSAWGKMADNCFEYLKKGSQVLVEGELRPDKETGNPRVFTRQDGMTGSSYEVLAKTVRFLSSAGQAQQSEQVSQDDGDIPF